MCECKQGERSESSEPSKSGEGRERGLAERGEAHTHVVRLEEVVVQS